jgi:hypothetical protein
VRQVRALFIFEFPVVAVAPSAMAENHKQKSPTVRYGLDNPHPLSQLKTELVWDGKYDEYGNRRAVDIAGCAMPLQKIETIDEPRSRAAADGNLELFEKEKKRRDDFRNRLIWGDNKLVMASLLAEFKGKLDLIYIDPPFDVGADFTMNVPIGERPIMFGNGCLQRHVGERHRFLPPYDVRAALTDEGVIE